MLQLAVERVDYCTLQIMPHKIMLHSVKRQSNTQWTLAVVDNVCYMYGTCTSLEHKKERHTTGQGVVIFFLCLRTRACSSALRCLLATHVACEES